MGFCSHSFQGRAAAAIGGAQRTFALKLLRGRSNESGGANRWGSNCNMRPLFQNHFCGLKSYTPRGWCRGRPLAGQTDAVPASRLHRQPPMCESQWIPTEDL
jgi:hypothetical protein